MDLHRWRCKAEATNCSARRRELECGTQCVSEADRVRMGIPELPECRRKLRDAQAALLAEAGQGRRGCAPLSIEHHPAEQRTGIRGLRRVSQIDDVVNRQAGIELTPHLF